MNAEKWLLLARLLLPVLTQVVGIFHDTARQANKTTPTLDTDTAP